MGAGSRPRPALPVTGGSDDQGRPRPPGPAYAVPPVLLGQQVIGIGLDEQLFEHRVHDVPPRVGSCILGAGAGTFLLTWNLPGRRSRRPGVAVPFAVLHTAGMPVPVSATERIQDTIRVELTKEQIEQLPPVALSEGH